MTDSETENADHLESMDPELQFIKTPKDLSNLKTSNNNSVMNEDLKMMDQQTLKNPLGKSTIHFLPLSNHSMILFQPSQISKSQKSLPKRNCVNPIST
jgi:hypothetical protein